MITEPIKASDPQVKKGMWIYCPDKPSGWFLITARWRSAVMNGRNVHIAVNARGARYLLDFRPDDEVRIRSSAED